MRRAYFMLLLLIISLSTGLFYGKEEPSLPVFGMRQSAAEAVSDIHVVPLGMTIGVRINTDGVMVLGTGVVHGEDGETFEPSKGLLLAGDLVLKVNNSPILNKEYLSKFVAESEGELSFYVRRDGVNLP